MELGRAMIEEFERLHRRPDLLAAFVRHAEGPGSTAATVWLTMLESVDAASIPVRD